MWINHKYQLRLSVRTKGMIVFLALIMYALSIAIFAFHQKELMLNDFEEIQVTLETETLLKQAEVSAFHTVMAIFATVGIKDTSASMQRIQLHYQSLNDTETDLMQRLPADALNLDGLHAAWDIVEKDASRSNLDRLSVELIKTKDDIATLMDQLQNQRKSLSDHYRTQSDAVAATTLMLGILGLGLLGAIIGLFFRRLTDDLRILQTHALGIVKGVRSQPLTITRHDEIGQLMIAVNQMADIVDRREKELMLERQKYFHQEKMAAIGALAAGVAHEIGNPIAAISGIAQAMIDSRKDSKSEEKGCMANDCANCHPELIYTQTQRLAAITREIAEFASPRAIAADFLDLNEQLRNASKLIRYDKRLQGVLLELNLDSQLNAVYGVADQLTQLIMNLLINSMDALEGITHALNRTPAITSSQDINNIYVIIEDNGCGIEPHTLQRVFEAFFTTKPAGKGTGLGLSLCYSIAQNHGGNIDISSSLNIGTRVTLTLPMNLPLKEINFI